MRWMGDVKTSHKHNFSQNVWLIKKLVAKSILTGEATWWNVANGIRIFSRLYPHLCNQILLNSFRFLHRFDMERVALTSSRVSINPSIHNRSLRISFRINLQHVPNLGSFHNFAAVNWEISVSKASRWSCHSKPEFPLRWRRGSVSYFPKSWIS